MNTIVNRRTKKHINLIILLILITFCGISLFAEDDEGKPQVCIFISANYAKESDMSEKKEINYKDIITESISIELNNEGFIVIEQNLISATIEQRKLTDKDLIIGENTISIAKELNADTAITGFYYIDNKRILLELKCYDVNSGILVAGVLEQGRTGISIHNVINKALSSMLPKLEYHFNRYIAKVERTGNRITGITFFSQEENMRLFLAGDEFLGEIINGSIYIEKIHFNIGEEITIYKKKDGFHDGAEKVIIETEGQEITLKPMIKETRFASEILWTTGQWLGLGVGFRYYFKPDYFFISSDNYLYIQHDFQDDSSNTVFHNDFRFLLGFYPFFFKHSYLCRMGISAGFGMILTFYSIPEQQANTDFYFNPINVWIEWNIKKWAIFLRVEAKYSLGWGNDTLGKNWMSVGDNYGPPVTIGVFKKW